MNNIRNADGSPIWRRLGRYEWSIQSPSNQNCGGNHYKGWDIEGGWWWHTIRIEGDTWLWLKIHTPNYKNPLEHAGF